MPRPSSTAATMDAKLSSVSTMSALSLATSVPVIPIATPRSDLLSAGASFTPSPVIATMCPAFFQASTMRILCSGATRAYTRIRSTSRTNSASEGFSSSSPERARYPSSRIPISRATAIAVSLWSPVIITTRMPAFLQRRIASIASDRGASIMPASPRNVRSTSRVSSVSRGTSPWNSRMANPITLPSRLRIHAGAPRCDQQGTFRRTALDEPAGAFSLEDSVIAQGAALEESLHAGMAFETHASAMRPDEPRWIETLPDGLVLMGTDDEDPDVHFSFRERPGLVGADHGGGAQCLDCREFPDQRASSDHSLEAQREADRHDRGEPLGNRRD